VVGRVLQPLDPEPAGADAADPAHRGFAGTADPDGRTANLHRGADYFGAVLNRAARVMAAGQRLLGGADRLLDARSADTMPSSASRSGSRATDHSAIGLTPAAAHCLDDLALQVRRPAR
jgi:hypothetical protein